MTPTERILNYLANRLREPSTYPMLVLAFTASGVALTEDQKALVLSVGLFAAGLIGAALPDRMGKKQDRADDPPKEP